MVIRVERRQVLAYRAFAQGLHRHGESVEALAVLDLGVQNTPVGSARHALATRLAATPADAETSPGLAVTWSLRGAPHVHRADDLVPLSRALWPWSDADALARLDTSASPVRSSGMPAREALRFVAEQIADIVTEPLAKGEVSAALTPRVPEAMTVACRQCKATHIVETLFRAAVLPAGITFDREERTVTFVAVPGWPGVPADSVGAERIVHTYLRVLGPAAPGHVAAFLGTTAAELEPRWPAELVEVDVAGEPAWLPASGVDDLLAPPDPPAVRLLPPSDPFLQARDREVIVPEEDHRKVLWPILGRPGAVLVEGEVAGVWRARKKGRRLEVTVQPFRRMTASVRRGIDEEAALAARVRGVADATVTLQ